MTRVNTALGEGKIIESSSSRGRTMHLVEGPGFSRWFEASEVFAPDEVEMSKEERVDTDNSTRLPYNPTPQHSDFTLPDEATLQPIYEIDSEKRLEDEDSLDVDKIAEKLGPKFVRLKETQVDRDSVAGRMTSDPERYAREIRASFEPVDESNRKIADLFHLMDSDPMIREAAWIDVQKKAVRLRTSGNVDVQDMTPRAIHARVEGDHGTYDTVVVRGGATVGAGSISEWACDCEWGRWAFVRKHTYVGRLCSHAYAAYMELQAKTRVDFNQELEKNRNKKNKPALLPYRSSAAHSLGLLEGFVNWADNWADPVQLEEYISEKDLNSREAEELDRRINSLFEYTELDGENTDEVIRELDRDPRFVAADARGVEVENYYPHTHYVAEDDVQEDNRSYILDEDEELSEDDLYKVAHGDPFTGFHIQVFTNGDGHEFGVIYNPLDQSVEEVAPDNGIQFVRGEEEEALADYLKGLSDEEAFGTYFDIVEETPASKNAHRKFAGRIFSFQEQMDLINEAPGDDEILARLDLRGTHYEH